MIDQALIITNIQTKLNVDTDTMKTNIKTHARYFASHKDNSK